MQSIQVPLPPQRCFQKTGSCLAIVVKVIAPHACRLCVYQGSVCLTAATLMTALHGGELRAIHTCCCPDLHRVPHFVAGCIERQHKNFKLLLTLGPTHLAVQQISMVGPRRSPTSAGSLGCFQASRYSTYVVKLPFGFSVGHSLSRLAI